MWDSLRLTLKSRDHVYSHSTKESLVKIGRSLKCDFCVPKEDLSREHCLIEMKGEEYFITDLGSKNGVCVDGVKLVPHKLTKVGTASTIVLSNVYTLQINAFDVKTKAEIVFNHAVPDIQTNVYDMDVPEEKMEVVPGPKYVRRPARDLKKERPSQNYDSLKMLLGFLTILGIVLYHALGR